MKNFKFKKNTNIYNQLASILPHEKVQEMKNYIQHGAVSTYDHCFNVACSCNKFASFFRLNVNYKELTLGAFLHDFYLYDWHTDSPKDSLHAFSHPGLAAQNTSRFFNFNNNILNIIKTHMWPINILQIPKSKEAWIVCLCDKYISVMETIKRKF